MATRVMHYYTYPKNSGGPLTYINNIVGSEYFPDVVFGVCFQGKAASSLRFSDLRRITNEIKAFSPDILHIHGVQSEGFIGVYVGKKAKVPKILMTVHGLQIEASNISPVKRFIFEKFIEPYALKNSDGVYCVCNSMTNSPFIKKHSRKLFPTVHNFITDKFFEHEKENTSEKNEKICIVTVGRVSKDKGMEDLQKCIINDKNLNTQYKIIGSGDYEEKMRASLASQIDNKKVVFLGQRSDVKTLLNDADIFLFPSHHENLSIALLEAASQKCCCIATNVGGNSEIIEHNKNGILVPANDYTALLNAVNSVVSDCERRKIMSEKLLEKVSTDFSEKNFAEKLNKIYLNIL